MCILDKLAIFMYMHISKHLPVTAFFFVAELNLVLIFCFGSSPRIQQWHTNGLWVQHLCMNVQPTQKASSSRPMENCKIEESHDDVVAWRQAPMVLKTPVFLDMLGHIFNGSGKPINNGPPILSEAYSWIFLEVLSTPVREPIQKRWFKHEYPPLMWWTQLHKSKKIPLFSAAGLPHNEIAAQICRQAGLVN